MPRVELHCHTVYSKDSLTQPESIIKTCNRKGIERIAITDHNNIAGAVYAKNLGPQRVIVGEEIMTTRGELLAFFVQEEVPAGLTPLEAIQRLREQGAFISVSHPFDYWRAGHWGEIYLWEIKHLVDAIEVFNARCLRQAYNRAAEAFAQQHNLLGTVGSDAHTGFEVGRATLLLPDFQDAESFKLALKAAKMDCQLSTPLVHLSSRYAVWRKRFDQRSR